MVPRYIVIIYHIDIDGIYHRVILDIPILYVVIGLLYHIDMIIRYLYILVISLYNRYDK